MRQQQVNLRLLMIGAPVVMALIVVSRIQHLPKTVDSGCHLVMGTYGRILAVAPTQAVARTAIAAGFRAMERIDGLMSTYRTDTELSIANEEAAERPVPVSQDTFRVLQAAGRFHRLSGGAFDVTVGPWLALWRAAADSNTPPSAARCAAVREHVGWDKVRLDPNALTVRFTVPGVSLDLGGIAKGYAIDQALEAARAAGAVGAMVDIGGDIRCFGTPARGRAHWRIGIQDPRVETPDDPGTVLAVLNVGDRAVATSGHYRRFRTVAGRRISHIVEPVSGQGSMRLASTTIVAPDALSADALATAVTVLGAERGLALIETLDGVEALVVPAHTEPLELRRSSGAGAYLAEGPG